MQGRDPLSMSVGQRQAGVDQQAVAVLHQSMPHEAQLRLLASSFAVEPGVPIGGRGMRLVRLLLAMEVGFCVAPAAYRRFGRFGLFGLTLFIDRPCLDQRAVDPKVIRGPKFLHLGLRKYRRQELRRDRRLRAAGARFFENAEWSHTASSTPMPTNQRNRRSYSSRSIKSRSDRIE